MPMEIMRNLFESTQSLGDVSERTNRRDELMNEMYHIACGIGEEGVDMNVDDNVRDETVRLGDAAAFLASTLARVHRCASRGGMMLMMTDGRLEQLMFLTQLTSSKYIRHTARQVTRSIIVPPHENCSMLLTKTQKSILARRLATYSADGGEGAAWVWECLLRLCPLSEDSFVGSLVAQCVGDALGFVVEGHPSDTCKDYVAQFVVTQTTPHWVRIPGFTFGQYSDDSQLARETYISVIQAGAALDPAVYALRIACMFQPGHYRIVGYGATTARAGEALFMGKHHASTGSTTTSGNGSAMRSGPLGLIMSQLPMQQIIDTTRVFSSVTHASEACLDASVVIALGARAAMATRSVPFNIPLFLAHVASHVTNVEYGHEVRNIAALVNVESEDAAKAHIVAYGIEMKEDRWDGGISPGVRQSSLWALYSFCKHPDCFCDAIATAIRCGGDVDTTAAMTGALLGARIGFDGVPVVWRNVVHDIDDWTLTELVELVGSVFALVDADAIRSVVCSTLAK